AEIEKADGGRAEFLKGEIFRKRAPQSEFNLRTALSAYEQATTFKDVPVSAYREAGLLYRAGGDIPAAVRAFQTYLEHAPEAPDAPLVKTYLNELGPAVQ